MGKKIDLTGQKIGRLTVIKEDPRRDKYGRVKWICRCDCGNVVSVSGRNLRSGGTLSCGCFQKESVRKDVIGGTKVSTITSNRKQNSNNTSGKRGVYWDKNKNKWVAQIGFKKKDFHLGASKDFKTACRMRDEAEDHLYRGFLEWYSKTYPEDWSKLDKNHKEQNEKRGEEE